MGSEDDYSCVYTFITQDIEDSEDSEDAGDGEYYYCDECLALFEGTQQYTTQEPVEFCVGVASEIIKNNPTWIITIMSLQVFFPFLSMLYYSVLCSIMLCRCGYILYVCAFVHSFVSNGYVLASVIVPFVYVFPGSCAQFFLTAYETVVVVAVDGDGDDIMMMVMMMMEVMLMMILTGGGGGGSG